MDRHQRCTECGSTEIVEDHAQGNLTCTQCATVLECHLIDESAEWRSFADKDKESTDMTRVGGVINPLLTDGLATSIGEATKGNTSAAGAQGSSNSSSFQTLRQDLQRTQRRGGNPDQALQTAFGTIRKISDGLRLNQRIQDRAAEVFKQTMPLKLATGRGTAATCVAVVFAACRLERLPRTFKEILAVIPEADQKKVHRAYMAIQQYLQENKISETVSTVHPADFLRRFGSRLGFSHKDMLIAAHIAEAACPRDGMRPEGQQPWDGRSPITVAAGIIYMVSTLPGVTTHPPLSQIAEVSGMAESTIQGVCSELAVHKRKFVPPAMLEKL